MEAMLHGASMLHEMPLPILVGPTGAGKTAIAIELCELLNGEIISADSMQLYRGLNIGTAKATLEEQSRARHHLIDILDPDEEYSAARWSLDARRAINEITARGKQPVIVGGTGFYLTALLFPGRLAGAPPDAALRAQMQEIAAREGNDALHRRLQELDAVAARRLHPNDTRRVIRAIEVALSHVANAASESTLPAESDAVIPFAAFGLSWPREVLYTRLDARVDQMLEDGFMDVLRVLVQSGYSDTLPLQNLGYRHMRAALENPALFESAVELWKRDTRRYAKRQMTWFRHQLSVQWIDVTERTSAETAERIAMTLQQCRR